MRKLRAAVVAVLTLILAAPAAFADSNVRIVRLSLVDGDTEVDRRDGNGFQAAFLNLPVVEGQRLWARDDEARAEVEFEDGSTMRLIPQSLAEFTALGRRSNGDLVTEIDLQEGVAYFNLRRHGTDEFTVRAGPAQIMLPESGHFRVNVEQGKIEIAVFEGSLQVRGEDYSLDVRKSEMLTLDLTDPGRYFLARSFTADSWDDWDHDREQARADAAAAAAQAQAAYASANTYYAPVDYGYNYGYNDLSMYGSYIYVGGYGRLWRPASYGINWNPWMDGAWVWYPGFGYVWVSAYPWGWLPYRYGAWVYVPTYGWCWNAGGHHWNGWVSHPVAVNPPHSFQPPHVPSGGGGGGGGGPVVVVGRGPITGRGPARVYVNGDNGGIGRENDPRFGRRNTNQSNPGNGGSGFIGGRDAGRSGGATGGASNGRPQWTGGGNGNTGQSGSGGGVVSGRGGSTGRVNTPPQPPDGGGELGRGRSGRDSRPDNQGGGVGRGSSTPPENRGGSVGNRGGSSAGVGSSSGGGSAGNRGGSSAGSSGSSGGGSPHTAPPPSSPPSRSSGATVGGTGSSSGAGAGSGRSASPPPQSSKPDKQQFRFR